MQIGFTLLGVCVVFVSKTQVNPSADLVHPEGQAVTADCALNEAANRLRVKSVLIFIILF
jgi:hypothetical protein